MLPQLQKSFVNGVEFCPIAKTRYEAHQARGHIAYRWKLVESPSRPWDSLKWEIWNQMELHLDPQVVLLAPFHPGNRTPVVVRKHDEGSAFQGRSKVLFYPA